MPGRSRPRRAEWLALAGVVVLGAANVLWELGASSLFIDESTSVDIAARPLGDIVSATREAETSPPTYFFGLHSWIGYGGSRADWFVRLPSALAVVALVVAVWWVARILAGRAVGLLAALLTALSPLVLNYGQQARMYALLMLAATVAAGCALRAAEAEGAARARWLAVSGVLATLCVALHYTGAVPAAVLAGWVISRAELPRRARAAYALVPLALAGVLLPLADDQFTRYPGGGLVGIAGLSWRNAVKVLASPWDGRAATDLDVPRFLALGALLGALAIVASPLARERVARRGLLLALAAGPLLVVLAGGLLGKDAVITRYTTAGVPFLLIVVAAAIVLTPRPAGIALATTALVASVAGVVATHQPSGRFADIRGAVATIRERQAPGDRVLVGRGVDLPLYREAARDPSRPLDFLSSVDLTELRTAIRRREQIWFVAANAPETLAAYRASLGTFGYRPAYVRRLDGAVPLGVVLAIPAQ